MKKMLPYICSVSLSLVLCAVLLFVPMEEGALWQSPCVNVYSLFAAAFFVMNTIGLIGIAGGYTFGEKPYTKERPVIEKKKHYVTSVVLTFFEAPLLLTVFFVDGGWKMAACTGLFVGGSLILGGIIGDVSANKLRKNLKQIEQRELVKQLKKEEG